MSEIFGNVGKPEVPPKISNSTNPFEKSGTLVYIWKHVEVPQKRQNMFRSKKGCGGTKTNADITSHSDADVSGPPRVVFTNMHDGSGKKNELLKVGHLRRVEAPPAEKLRAAISGIRYTQKHKYGFGSVRWEIFDTEKP